MLFRLVQRITGVTQGRASPLRLCPLGASWLLPREEGRGDLAPPIVQARPRRPRPAPRLSRRCL